MKIWCAFSVENNYDQPDNNLVCWWEDKPTLEQLANALGFQFPASEDETTLAIVKIWSGDSMRINETRYRLELVASGIPL